MYHYTESGLDNIYLEGGVTHHNTAYGEGVSIANVEGLHKAIGLWLIDLAKPLIGAELRFLRLEMEVTQRDLAAIIGVTEQSVSLWERSQEKPLQGPADRLLRALYREYVGGDGKVRWMLERMAQLDQVGRSEAHLWETKDGWQVEERAV